MFELFDRDTPKEAQLLAMKAVDSRLVQLGGGGYSGLGFKLKALKVCGFDDQGRPDPVQKIAAYQKAIAILNELGDDATGEAFMSRSVT